MTPEGRVLLERIRICCLGEWVISLRRYEDCMEPFGPVAWHNAVHIVEALYHNWPVAEFQNLREVN